MEKTPRDTERERDREGETEAKSQQWRCNEFVRGIVFESRLKCQIIYSFALLNGGYSRYR